MSVYYNEPHDLRALVLVFVPAEEFEKHGWGALYSRIDPCYPHEYEGTEGEDFDGHYDPPLPPHTWVGRVHLIVQGSLYDHVFPGGTPPPSESACFPGRLRSSTTLNLQRERPASR